jgi:hypothetical protein
LGQKKSFECDSSIKLAYRFDGTFVWKSKKFQHRFDVAVNFRQLLAGIDFVPQNGQIVLPDLEVDDGSAESFSLGAGVGDDLAVVCHDD